MPQINTPPILLIIPCYNEENRFPIHEFSEYSQNNPTLEFLFVNDGSTDKTLDILKDLNQQNQKFHYLNLAENSGKGEAIRQAVLSVKNLEKYQYVGYFDADLAIPLSELQHFLYYLNQSSKLKMAMGCRLVRLGSKIDRTTFRHLISRGFATLVSNILELKVYDTQNGAKLIDVSLAPELFAKPFNSRWLFDVEILFRLKRKYGTEEIYDTVVEVPLSECKNIPGSKLKMKDFIKAPKELFQIWAKYR